MNRKGIGVPKVDERDGAQVAASRKAGCKCSRPCFPLTCYNCRKIKAECLMVGVQGAGNICAPCYDAAEDKRIADETRTFVKKVGAAIVRRIARALDS